MILTEVMQLGGRVFFWPQGIHSYFMISKSFIIIIIIFYILFIFIPLECKAFSFEKHFIYFFSFYIQVKKKVYKSFPPQEKFISCFYFTCRYKKKYTCHVYIKCFLL